MTTDEAPHRTAICVYDTQQKYQPIKMVASEVPVKSIALVLNEDGSLLAALGPKPACVVVFDAVTMNPLKKLRREKRKSGSNEDEVRWGVRRPINFPGR